VRSPDDERLFTTSDHTAVVAFCLRERERLRADSSFPDTVLHLAAIAASVPVALVLAEGAHNR
jgi:hypothetical protein